jgi:4-amino-4-deoxy-L-arabinose transferase-like glycosyltransferase
LRHHNILGKRNTADLLAFILFAICFIFFYTFWDLPVKSWDEAVYANNAIEMSKNHNYWVLHNNGKPDLFNTKPPFVIWLQSFFISVFGITELSIRIPSFLSLLIIVLVLFKNLNKISSYSLPFFSNLILLSSFGFIGFHGISTGDLDATLTMWLTLIIVVVFNKILNANGFIDTKWIYILFVLFFMGFLTKSTAIFLVTPGLIATIFIFKKEKVVFKNKHFYIASIITVCLITGYYCLMDFKTPGYFKAAWLSEYKRIFFDVMPWHKQPFNYYFNNLLTRFFPWIYLLIPGIITGFVSKTPTIKKLTIYLTVICISYLSLISFAPNKLEWYDVPLYPLFAVLTGILLHEIEYYVNPTKNYFTLLFYAFFLFITGLQISKNLMRIKTPSYKEPLEFEGIALKQLVNEKSIYKLKILMSVENIQHYNQLNFYRQRFFIQRGLLPEVITEPAAINDNDTVLVCQQKHNESLSKFKIDTIKKVNSCVLVRVDIIK